MINKKTHAVTSVSSFIFSFLASSHHWLHMGILLLIGGSTNMMATMSAAFWIISLTALSILLSLGFIFYTLFQFGW